MLSQLLLVLVSAITLVCGQSVVTIDPSTVPLATRQSWCLSQTSSCPLLCLQMPGVSSSSAPLANNCSAQTLDYYCVCSNNLSPNASQYSETIPYFVCTEHNNQCVNACDSGDSTCQSDCRTQNLCGAQAPTRVNVIIATTTHATSASSAFVANTMVGDATGAAPKLVSVDIGHVYGLCVLVAGFIAGFAALL